MIKVDQREVASAQVRPTTPTVAPATKKRTWRWRCGRGKTSSEVQERPVVARTAPPPTPVSFVKHKQAIQANGGLRRRFPDASSADENAQQARRTSRSHRR